MYNKRNPLEYGAKLHSPFPISLKDALDCGSDTNIFSTLATLLHEMVLSLDNLPAHLLSHTSHTLLFCTTLPFSANSVPTLVDSGATNNLIDESLVVLAPQHLQYFPTPILLKLFNSNLTSIRDIIHCMETTMTFTNEQCQAL
ncbi:hypothetical protein E4T56_gene7150 [Termitomyces sp. T112]|nr:hypothetical protein E4T56_gene7150 [Termitomyces sp. T112]